MPITTRTVAKGIPPRLHKPKTLAKAGTSKPKQSKKRVASDSELENESEEDPVKKKTKGKKRLHVDSGSEVEVVNEDSEPEKEVEEVDVSSDGGQDDQEEVSKDYWPHTQKLTKSLGG